MVDVTRGSHKTFHYDNHIARLDDRVGVRWGKEKKTPVSLG